MNAAETYGVRLVAALAGLTLILLACAWWIDRTSQRPPDWREGHGGSDENAARKREVGRLHRLAGVAYWIFFIAAGTAAQRVRERRLRRRREKIERARNLAGETQGGMGPILEEQGERRMRGLARDKTESLEQVLSYLEPRHPEFVADIRARRARSEVSSWQDQLSAECAVRLEPLARDIADHASERNATADAARRESAQIIAELMNLWSEVRTHGDVKDVIRTSRLDLEDIRLREGHAKPREERGE